MAKEKNSIRSAEMLMEALKSADNIVSGASDTPATLALRALFDNGSFVRLSAFMIHKEDAVSPEGVICAYGSVCGKPVFAFSEDILEGGAPVGQRHVSKIKSLYQRALGSGTPIVGFFNSLGGSVEEGSALLSAFGELADCVCSAKGIVPQIAVVNGKCTGMLASISQLFDFTVVTKDSELYFSPSFLVGDSFSDPRTLSENGIAAYLAEDAKEASDFVRKLLSLIPLNKNETKYLGECEDDINRTIKEVLDENYDIVKVISDLSDDRTFVQLYKEYAKAIVVGFASFDGILCGVVANDHRVNDGAITANACRKAADFIDFCSSFGIPLLTLVDTVGFEISADNEKSGVMKASSELMLAYSKAKGAKITVIIGKAYGAGFTVMGSRSLGADEVLALKDALVSAMSPASAVAFSENDKITLDKDRATVEDEWTREHCPALLAAANGDIDDIIESAFLRAHICTAVGMFASKSAKASELI